MLELLIAVLLVLWGYLLGRLHEHRFMQARLEALRQQAEQAEYRQSGNLWDAL